MLVGDSLEASGSVIFVVGGMNLSSSTFLKRYMVRSHGVERPIGP